jgi:asparagine synthase (glutamine-hydrolysing)
MCGIFIWVNRKRDVTPSLAAEALATMKRRGPDWQGMYLWNDGKPGSRHEISTVRDARSVHNAPQHLIMGHARLSIIDLSDAARQPMIAPDDSVLCFNGTIYNYIELRKQLEKAGERFETQSDSEVLLHWLRRHGTGRMNDLNGNWAFAFFDPRARKIAFSRDTYGERPLYYYQDEDNFIAASEIKAIFTALKSRVRVLDGSRVSSFICHQNWPHADASRTIYRDIRRMEPGTSMIFDLDSHTAKFSFTHDLTQKFQADPDPKNIWGDFQQAVEFRLRSDVPIGVFVSGGVDSTSVAAAVCAAQHRPSDITFYTAKFPGQISQDLHFARTVAENLGIDLREIEIPYSNDAVAQLEKLSFQYDQPVPFAGTTLSESILYEAIAGDGVRVALTGTGGDEVFGGYGNEYIEAALTQLTAERDFIQLGRSLSDAISGKWTTLPAVGAYLRDRLKGARPKNKMFMILASAAKGRFREFIENCGIYYWAKDAFRIPLPELQMYDSLHGRLASYVTFADNNAMMSSIEARCPFMDPNLAKYMHLPVRDKYKGDFNKYALRTAMPDIVGQSVIWRRGKQGFTYLFEQFYQSNKAMIYDNIRQSPILNEMFDMPATLRAIDGIPLHRDFVLHMFSLSKFCEFQECAFDATALETAGSSLTP